MVTKGLDIGGIERIVVDLAIGLQGAGCQVEVAVVNERRNGFVGLLDARAVPVHRLGGTDLIGARALWSLVRLIRSGRFDVVHTHGPLPTIVARLVPGRPPLVTTSHTVWNALRLPSRILWRATARLDAATLAVSAVVERSLPRRRARPVSVVPHGVDPAAVRLAIARRDDEAGRVGSAGSHVTAIAVASHRDVKNYPNLLRAVSLARSLGADLSLVAVGEGPQLDRHRRMAVELGLGDAVRFVPPTLDPLAAIAAADLLVVASDFEGQPLVVAEALALGCPVVATAVGRVPELVSPSVGRVVRPGDARALAVALAEVAIDDELRRRLARNAAEQGGSWTLDHVVAAHKQIYADVTRRSGP